MVDVAKRLVGAALQSTETTLYTVPSGKTTIIKALSVCNNSSSSVSFTLRFANFSFTYQHPIKPYDTIVIPYIDQILTAGERISGSASIPGTVICLISGREVTP